MKAKKKAQEQEEIARMSSPRGGTEI